MIWVLLTLAVIGWLVYRTVLRLHASLPRPDEFEVENAGDYVRVSVDGKQWPYGEWELVGAGWFMDLRVRLAARKLMRVKAFSARYQKEDHGD